MLEVKSDPGGFEFKRFECILKVDYFEYKEKDGDTFPSIFWLPLLMLKLL